MHGVLALKFAQLKMKSNVWDVKRVSTRELMVLQCRKRCSEGFFDWQESIHLVILEILQKHTVLIHEEMSISI
jgi:hypothetical protein